MRKTIFRLTLGLLLFSISGAIFGSSPIKVTDDLGKAIELLHPPKRIVSLAPSITETVFALGLDQEIVGVSDYCDYPEKAKYKLKVGGFVNPDIDKIVSLNPDLVFAFGTIQRPVVEKLAAKGQKVFWLYPHIVNEVLGSFERIGLITGNVKAARKLRNKVEKRIQAIQRQLNHARGKNVFAQVKKDYFQIDLNTLTEKDPDAIIICGNDPEKLKSPLKNKKGWRHLTAISHNKILVIPCNLICGPGPRIGETIERIALYLYPEKFAALQQNSALQASTSSTATEAPTTNPHSNNYPQRIVSLGPAITEELYLLGVQDKLIANTIYCQRPPEAKQKLKIGTVITVDVEKIFSLKPDLVLATSLTDSRQVEKLRQLGVRVKRFQQAKNFAQICENFLQLGKIVGKEKKAQEIVEKVKKRIQIIKAKFEKLPKPRVFIQVGANPLFTVTKDSFINELIELAGGTNVARGVKSGLYSREQVVEQNPDIILIVTMGVVGEQEKKIWQKFQSINAVRNNKIYIVDSDKVCSPTPLSFVEALEEFATIFHPEVNDE